MIDNEKKQRARRGRGEGAIGHQNGRWYAEVSLGFDGNGKRIRKRVYGASKKEVQDELRKLQDQANRGGVPQAGTMSVGKLLDSWLDAMKPTWAAGTHAVASTSRHSAMRGLKLKLHSLKQQQLKLHQHRLKLN